MNIRDNRSRRGVVRTGVLLSAVVLLMTSCQPDDQTDVILVTELSDDHFIGVFDDYEVIDGDTFHIRDFTRGFRFLCIDTEEVPRGDDAMQQLAGLRAAWPASYEERRGDKRFPIKMPTPFGYETSEWAKQWFKDVDSIRLERDSNDNVFGYFGRTLAYVYAYKDGEWVNYNVECVRQGGSPYFGKYGFSSRFHDVFEVAQEEARYFKRGIWNTDLQHYPDYEERLSWWNARGASIKRYLGGPAEHDHSYFIGRDGEFERLALAGGKEVVVFGPVHWLGDARPVRTLKLPHKKDLDVRVILPDGMQQDVLEQFEQQYIYARGTVSGGGQEITITCGSPDDISRVPHPSWNLE
ncbi:MAG: hypothetical protein C0600_15355 [Ignavibacteria bacterium]|nr:MAG: hypothetical protein C0600_15355 [Ignavibacteria bacterium]